MLAMVHDRGQGTGPRKVGSVLYMRGLISAMLGVEGRAAGAGALRQGKGHDRRAGALGPENLNLDQGKLDAMGFAGVMRPVQTSCTTTWARRGCACIRGMAAKWAFSSDWYQADDKVLRPMVLEAASKYAAEKNLRSAVPRSSARSKLKLS